VFNRIVTLRDTWGRRVDASSAAAQGRGAGEAAEPTAPGRDSGRELRDETRAGDVLLQALFKRFQEDLELSEDQADILTGSKELAAFFEAAVASHANAPSLANWIVNELLRELKDRPLTDLPMRPGDLATLVNLLDEGTISQPVAKEIFVRMVEKGIDPQAEVAERGLEKLSDRDTLGALADEVLSENPRKAQEYRDGKTGLMGFFTGQVMRRTQGRADPRVVQEIFHERLGS